MRVVRFVSRAIGWVFVAAIGYHAVLAAIQAERAASGGHWVHAGELIAIALLATALVIAALFSAVQLRRR